MLSYTNDDAWMPFIFLDFWIHLCAQPKVLTKYGFSNSNFPITRISEGVSIIIFSYVYTHDNSLVIFVFCAVYPVQQWCRDHVRKKKILEF